MKRWLLVLALCSSALFAQGMGPGPGAGITYSGGGSTVAFDAVGPSGGGGAGFNFTGTNNPASPLTWTHPGGSGSNRLLVVGCSIGADALDTLEDITGITYNGVALTNSSAGKVHSNSNNNGFTMLWYLVAPDTGSQTVSVAYSNVLVNDSIQCGSVTFTGVSQSTPLGTPATATGSSTTPSVNVTGASTSNMVIDVVGNGSGITSSGKTLRWKKENTQGGAAGRSASATATSAAGTVTMSYTVTSDWWGIIAVEVLHN